MKEVIKQETVKQTTSVRPEFNEENENINDLRNYNTSYDTK